MVQLLDEQTTLKSRELSWVTSGDVRKCFLQSDSPLIWRADYGRAEEWMIRDVSLPCSLTKLEKFYSGSGGLRCIFPSNRIPHACYKIQSYHKICWFPSESFTHTRSQSLKGLNQQTELLIPDIHMAADRLHCSLCSSGPHPHQSLLPSFLIISVQWHNKWLFFQHISTLVSQWYRVELKITIE